MSGSQCKILPTRWGVKLPPTHKDFIMHELHRLAKVFVTSESVSASVISVADGSTLPLICVRRLAAVTRGMTTARTSPRRTTRATTGVLLLPRPVHIQNAAAGITSKRLPSTAPGHLPEARYRTRRGLPRRGLQVRLAWPAQYGVREESGLSDRSGPRRGLRHQRSASDRPEQNIRLLISWCVKN